MILGLPHLAVKKIIQFHGGDFLTFGSVCTLWLREYLSLTKNSKETPFSSATESIGKFELYAKCIVDQFALSLNYNTLSKFTSRTFEIILGYHDGMFDNSPLTCPHQKQFVLSILNGPYGFLAKGELRIVSGIKLQNNEIWQNAIVEQNSFDSIFYDSIMDINSCTTKTLAYCVIELFGVGSILELANEKGNNFVLTNWILLDSLRDLEVDDLQTLIRGIPIEDIDIYVLQSLLKATLKKKKYGKMSLFLTLGTEMFGNDNMTEMVIDLVRGNRVYPEFGDDSMAEIVIDFVKRRKSGLSFRVFERLTQGIVFPADAVERLFEMMSMVERWEL